MTILRLGCPASPAGGPGRPAVARRPRARQGANGLGQPLTQFLSSCHGYLRCIGYRLYSFKLVDSSEARRRAGLRTLGRPATESESARAPAVTSHWRQPGNVTGQTESQGQGAARGPAPLGHPGRRLGKEHPTARNSERSTQRLTPQATSQNEAPSRRCRLSSSSDTAAGPRRVVVTAQIPVARPRR